MHAHTSPSILQRHPIANPQWIRPNQPSNCQTTHASENRNRLKDAGTSSTKYVPRPSASTSRTDLILISLNTSNTSAFLSRGHSYMMITISNNVSRKPTKPWVCWTQCGMMITLSYSPRTNSSLRMEYKSLAITEKSYNKLDSFLHRSIRKILRICLRHVRNWIANVFIHNKLYDIKCIGMMIAV